MSSGTRRQSAPGGSVSPPQSPTTNPKSTTDQPIPTVTTAAGVTQSHHQRLDDDSFMSSSVPIARRFTSSVPTPHFQPLVIRAKNPPINIAASTFDSSTNISESKLQLNRGQKKAPEESNHNSVSSLASSNHTVPTQPQSPSSTGTPVRNIIGSFKRQASRLSVTRPSWRQRTTSQMTTASRASSQYIILTDSMSVLPTLGTSVVSVDHLTPAADNHHLPDLVTSPVRPGDVAISLTGLEKPDIYDNREYLDTIQSTDSGGSLLRRTLSMPQERALNQDYHYREGASRNKKPPHCKEIFADFLPPDVTVSKDDDLDMRGSQAAMWKKTMEDLLEQPEYDTSHSANSQTGLLAKAAREFARAESLIEREPEPSSHGGSILTLSDDKRYMKNLLILSSSFMCLFTAYTSLRNLQSSLNPQGGLGMYGLSTLYASLLFGCFFSPLIVQRLRPKVTMLAAFCGMLVYVVANFHSSFYTLIPGCCVAGFSLANMWTAHATYLTNTAIRYADVTNKPLQSVLSQFNGIFFMFFQFSSIIGGVISSMVLMNRSVPQIPNVNGSLEIAIENSIFYNISHDIGMANSQQVCGAKFCHSTALESANVDISKNTVYLLVGIFTGAAILGIILLAVFLDKLEGVMARPKTSKPSLSRLLLSIFRFFADWRAVCLLALMPYSLAQMSFMFGEFTKAFVTCATGVHMVGYVMLCLSAFGALSSFINGRIQKHVGTLPLMLFAMAIHLCLYITMLLWQPSSERLEIFFIVAGLWGVAEGIFQTQVISLFGTLFSENKESAFAALKMMQASGACFMFVTAPYLCTQVKIYILGTVLLLAGCGYVTLEMKLRANQKQQQQLVTQPIKV